MKHVYIYIPLICLSFLFPTHALSKGDPIKGKDVYGICVACHGQNGEGLRATNSPRLAGQQDWYLVSQLEKFRSGLRGASSNDIHGSQMAAIGKTLANEQSLLDVVAYIETLEAGQPARTETTGDPKRGQSLFIDELTCTNCHGPLGQGYKEPYGKGSGAPRLSGQHDWYLIRQLQNFKAGIRGDLKDKFALEMRMRAKVDLQNDQVIKDVAAYLSTLK